MMTHFYRTSELFSLRSKIVEYIRMYYVLYFCNTAIFKDFIYILQVYQISKHEHDLDAIDSKLSYKSIFCEIDINYPKFNPFY